MKVNKNQRTPLSPFRRVLLFVVILLFTQQLYAQTTYTVAEGSQIKMAGTSNLHDWTMVANTFSCDAKLTIAGGKLKSIHSLNVILPVKNLKSEETIMDNRTYKTLNADIYDKMTFKLTSASVVAAQKLVKVTGNLTIAGVTNLITIQSNYVLNGDQSISFKGSKAIKMSDFNVRAPTFMMGSLTTGDDLIINIILNLKK